MKETVRNEKESPSEMERVIAPPYPEGVEQLLNEILEMRLRSGLLKVKTDPLYDVLLIFVKLQSEMVELQVA